MAHDLVKDTTMPALQVSARHTMRPWSYVLLERHASRDAFTDHRASAHFKDIVLDRLVPRLERRTIEALDAEPVAS
ncbi:MAG TPA: hypothetical protein VGM33_03515 [Baekduia sp.]|jgi:quinol monooxygenase YgiN